MTRFSVDVPTEQFAQDISDALERESKLVGQVSFNRASFIQNLRSLLDARCIALSSRASDVQHEYENVFTSARILTDIRPLFTASGTDITGMMIVHNLELNYFHNDDYEELFIALDDEDITALRKVLDRAELKTISLEKAIKKSGVPYFESK